MQPAAVFFVTTTRLLTGRFYRACSRNCRLNIPILISAARRRSDSDYIGKTSFSSLPRNAAPCRLTSFNSSQARTLLKRFNVTVHTGSCVTLKEAAKGFFQAQVLTLLLSALSTFGFAVMWRDHTLSSSADWQACTHTGMDLSQWITVLRTESEGTEWIRTYGLDFFERPEIALKIGSNTVDITIDYLKPLADFLLENTIEFVEAERIVGHPCRSTLNALQCVMEWQTSSICQLRNNAEHLHGLTSQVVRTSIPGKR